MNLVMAEPVKSKEPGAQRLTVAISSADYQKLERLKAKLLERDGKKATSQELASRWISEGIATLEAELARPASA